jgi:alpha-L-fucosidase
MTTWFDTARFGMFVHWGHSSQRGIELSWPLVGGIANLPSSNVGVDDYHASAATFDPQGWDAKALARQARELGMQYAVLTAKHHDGFAMFHTKQSDFSIEHTPFERDIVREFVEAMRGEGLKVGLYFSLIDWHHPDYPAFRDEDKPYVLGRARKPTPEQWERFVPFMFAQVRELMAEYGKIDVIWFDGQWERRPEEWRAAELAAMIRELQPGILINDRLPGAGDFETPEQFIPPQPRLNPWETCLTMNESWAYNPADDRWKSPRQLVHMLCEVAGRGGNLLLNAGPMGDGRLPDEITERLDAMQRWMAKHAESIIGTSPGLEPWQFYGPSTRRGETVYLHLLMRPYETISVRGVPVKRVRSVRVLGSGAELRRHRRTQIIDQLYNADPLGELTIEVPAEEIDDLATVVAIEFAEQPILKFGPTRN